MVEFLGAFCHDNDTAKFVFHSPDKASSRLWFTPDVAPSGVFLLSARRDEKRTAGMKAGCPLGG